MKSENILNLSVKGIAFCETEGNLDDYLDFSLKDQSLRNTVSSVLFTYFRKKTLIDHILKNLINKRPSAFLRRALSVAFVQILYHTGIEKFKVTDVTVSYVKIKEGKFSANFVNAVLRNFIRQLEEKDTVEQLTAAVRSVPDFLYERWVNNYSKDDADKIVNAIDSRPEFTFRSTVEIDQNDFENLKIRKISFPWTDEFYIADEPTEILNSHLLKEGSIYIQDPAASFFSSLVKDIQPNKILDYCSAPGGKAIILSSLFPDSKITATDRSQVRLERTRQNFCRMKIKNAEAINMEEFEKRCHKESFDFLLLDVPCSNTGVIRHRPDIMWKFNKETLKNNASLQKEILQKAVNYLAKSGYLLYSTCSIELEENEIQIENFLSDNPGFSLLKKKILLPSVTHDGAFAALLTNGNILK
ncbi:MAG TPA: hypothetical protein DD381_06690 [Lentisphaeria bacterium]|nr:MAG: hypothetical protein A2X47_13095 [Lentisphaerae bacterium GWF2_38_69]HBM16011.1 hypothetical protein [Lentisphaeria bacterium]